MPGITIIIAPIEVSNELRRHVTDSHVFCFEHVEEFERWRRPEAHPRPLAAEVHSAVWQTACDNKPLPHILWDALERLKSSPQADLTTFLPAIPLKRTFYRRWQETFPESPTQFLQRVRVLHALRLIHGGRRAPKAAAVHAGFLSVADFRRAVNRLRSTPRRSIVALSATP